MGVIGVFTLSFLFMASACVVFGFGYYHWGLFLLGMAIWVRPTYTEMDEPRRRRR